MSDENWPPKTDELWKILENGEFFSKKLVTSETPLNSWEECTKNVEAGQVFTILSSEERYTAPGAVVITTLIDGIPGLIFTNQSSIQKIE
jgi:hypothetical protein